MEFKAGQLVEYDGDIIHIKSIEYGHVVLSNGRAVAQDLLKNIKHLTRDEIIAHMISNGWEDAGTFKGHRLNIMTWTFNIGRQIRVYQHNGEYRSKLNFNAECTPDIISKMQEAHDYALALNNAP